MISLNPQYAPIALFVYKRPEHALKSLNALSECYLSDESHLYIFCDGPKNAVDQENVNRVRGIVASRKWCKHVDIINRENNLGLANSIISGVGQIIDKHGEIIVLEDDIIVSRYFLKFMNEALRFYRNNDKVMHIAAYMYPIPGSFPETFFSRLASCWGWATWKRAWDKFEPDPQICMNRIIQNGLSSYLDHDGSIHLTKLLQDQIEGKLDSWNIRWHASVTLNGGLCLHPNESLVENIGIDGSGTHCNSSNAFDVSLGNKNSFEFTPNVEESREFYAAIKAFYQKINSGRMRRLVNKLRSCLP